MFVRALRVELENYDNGDGGDNDDHKFFMKVK